MVEKPPKNTVFLKLLNDQIFYQKSGSTKGLRILSSNFWPKIRKIHGAVTEISRVYGLTFSAVGSPLVRTATCWSHESHQRTYYLNFSTFSTNLVIVTWSRTFCTTTVWYLKPIQPFKAVHMVKNHHFDDVYTYLANFSYFCPSAM